jgi:hypothetical protein
MAEESPPESTETNETTGAEVTTPETAEETSEGQPETFDRPYVETLRKESAGYRDRAKTAEARAEELAKRLHTSLVTATGKLADPSDLP